MTACFGKKSSRAQPKNFESLHGYWSLKLQEAVKPADALQGLLLDRIASNYFRKQMLLGIESVMMKRPASRTQGTAGRVNS
jgi:hypothetical protein